MSKVGDFSDYANGWGWPGNDAGLRDMLEKNSL